MRWVTVRMYGTRVSPAVYLLTGLPRKLLISLDSWAESKRPGIFIIIQRVDLSAPIILHRMVRQRLVLQGNIP